MVEVLVQATEDSRIVRDLIKYDSASTQFMKVTELSRALRFNVRG